MTIYNIRNPARYYRVFLDEDIEQADVARRPILNIENIKQHAEAILTIQGRVQVKASLD